MQIEVGQNPCKRCGTLTRAKGGTCRACHNGEGLPNPRELTTEQIGTYVAALRAELKRRRDEIDAALNEREAA